MTEDNYCVSFGDLQQEMQCITCIRMRAIAPCTAVTLNCQRMLFFLIAHQMHCVERASYSQFYFYNKSLVH